MQTTHRSLLSATPSATVPVFQRARRHSRFLDTHTSAGREVSSLKIMTSVRAGEQASITTHG
jgi:hypothetical protein